MNAGEALNTRRLVYYSTQLNTFMIMLVKHIVTINHKLSAKARSLLVGRQSD